LEMTVVSLRQVDDSQFFWYRWLGLKQCLWS
jgi:hypothetical protein